MTSADVGGSLLMQFFCKDDFKVEQFDVDTSIITFRCPSFLAADLLLLIDSMSQVARVASVQCRMSRTSFINKQVKHVS